VSCGPEPDDFWITDSGCCSGCGYWIAADERNAGELGFVVEESGVQPGSPDGPAVHWATGYILCPQCGIQLPYEVTT
jgi:hypothetical protein